MAEIKQILHRNNIQALFTTNNNLDKNKVKNYLDKKFKTKQIGKTIHEIDKQCKKEKIHDALRIFCPLYNTKKNPLKTHLQIYNNLNIKADYSYIPNTTINKQQDIMYTGLARSVLVTCMSHKVTLKAPRYGN